MDLFQPKSKIVLPKRKVQPPVAVARKLFCVHLRNTFTQGVGIVPVRCEKQTESGWLCPEHDFKTLSRKANPRHRNIHDEIIQTIKLTEMYAGVTGYATLPREVIGGKHKIQFVAGVRMHTPPEAIEVDDAATQINLNE